MCVSGKSLIVFLSKERGQDEVMGTERFRVFVPFLLMDGVLVFAVLMLLQLDWIVNNMLYSYGLSFSLN